MRSGDSLKYTGTVTAPLPLIAKSAVCHSGRLAASRPTRSPGFTPSSKSACAKPAVRRRNSSLEMFCQPAGERYIWARGFGHVSSRAGIFEERPVVQDPSETVAYQERSAMSRSTSTARSRSRILHGAVLAEKGACLRWRGRQAWRDVMSTVKTLAETGLSKGPFARPGARRFRARLATEAAPAHVDEQFDPEVAEKPEELVVYGGTGKAARNWKVSRDREIVARTRKRPNTFGAIGKPVGIFRTHDTRQESCSAIQI